MANVYSGQKTNRIKVSNDGAKYYGDLAKKYRDESAEYANSAMESAEIASTKESEVSAAATQSISDITDAKNTALSTLLSQQQVSEQAIDAKLQDAENQITETKQAAINDLQEIKDDVDSVLDDIANVDKVANSIENVDTLANCVDDINTCATDITAIKAAANNASEAKSSSQNAKIWAEGSDTEVQSLGGVHSAKGWNDILSTREYADKDLSNLNSAGQAVMKAKQDVANMTQSVSDGNEATTYPSTGAVRNALDEKQDVSYLTQSVDNTTASVSDNRYPSVRAVETALRKRQKISNLTSSVTTGTETYPSNKAVSDALALKQDVANLSQTLDTDTTKYPSNNVVNNAVQTLSTTKQDVANLSQTLDESETKYPSNKAVKTAIDEKDSFPPQTTDDTGKFLQTNGSEVSWETVRQVPSSGSTTWGKYLQSVGDSTYRWANLGVREVPRVDSNDIKSGTNTFLQAYKSGENLLYGWKTAYTNPPVEDDLDFPDRAIVFGRAFMNERDVWFDSDRSVDGKSSIAGYSWEAMAPAMPIGTIFSMICDEDWVPPYCVKADGSTYSGNAFKWLYGRRDAVWYAEDMQGNTGPASYPGAAVKYLPTSSTERYYKYSNYSSGYTFWTQGRPKVGGYVYKIDNPEASSPIIIQYYGLSISQVIAQADPEGWYSEEDQHYRKIKLEKSTTFNDPYIPRPEIYTYDLAQKAGNNKPRDPVTASEKYISQGILSTCTAEQYAKDLTAHGKCYKFVSDAAPDEVSTTVSANFRVPTIPDETVTTDADDTKQNGILRWFIVLGSMVSDDFSKEWNDSIDNKIPSTGDTTNNTEGA